MLIAFTLAVAIIGFGILLSPPFRGFRSMIGLPIDLYGSRYNPAVGAAEIINPDPEAAEAFLSRITLYYHSVFLTLLYATLILFISKYMGERGRDILDLMLISTIFTVSGGIIYAYLYRDFFWHGVFISGLAFGFLAGLLLLIRFRPNNILGYNIQLSGFLLLLGGAIGGWLGSSFMNPENHESFIEALIASRFNPDLGEENIFWRSLTSHEHAMIAVALTLVFLLAVSRLKLKEGRLTKATLYLVYFGQLIMALASYSVWFIGKVAHLAITPAALLLIFATLLLSFRVEGWRVLRTALVAGNIIMWIGVAIPGALVAVSLRSPRFFTPAFRDPLWDWAELAYNIGHWHILLTTWGVVLAIIYLGEVNRGTLSKIAGYLTIIGYIGASLGINLYMLGNPPGYYIPNPYDNIYLAFIVEPMLGIMAMGIALTYILFLRGVARKGLLMKRQ
jgi:hypothetical protein